MSKTMVVEGIEITMHPSSSCVELYNTTTGDKRMMCPIDCIQRKSDVWDFMVNYVGLNAVAKAYVEKITQDKLLQLI